MPDPAQLIQDYNREIFALKQTLTERNRQVASLKTEVRSLTLTIDEIRTSRTWRLMDSLHWYSRSKRRLATVYHNACILYKRAGGVSTLMRNALALYKRQGWKGVAEKLSSLLHVTHRRTRKVPLSSLDLYGADTPQNPDHLPKVSIIVPNYNHEPYLRERLDSIYAQTYTNFDVILLDDASQDGSRDILTEYQHRFHRQTRLCFNEKNSGGVFHQWKKGLELADGELIWIAESDDFCLPDFLEKLVPFFDNQAVMLSYCRSDFVKGAPPLQTWSIEEYLSDLSLDCWISGKPFIKSAHWLVNNALAIKNIVPNVSSTVFRHPGALDDLDAAGWTKLKLCGDWMFYLKLIRGGLVAYTPETTNYYRQHAQSTSLTTQQQDNYYHEHEIIAAYLLSTYRLDPKALIRQKDHLYRHWVHLRDATSADAFAALYDLQRAERQARPRKKNLLMAAQALVAGGGETFPVYLANMMKAHGYAVTFLNRNRQATEPAIRKLLKADIPLVTLPDWDLFEDVVEDLGIEVVHSHHLDLDITFATLLPDDPHLRRVITTHGMYEMLEDKYLHYLLPIMERHIHQFVYTAEKNLAPFSDAFRRKKSFVKIDNALPLMPVHPVSRQELGIGEDDFVLCLVARPIPEKGWAEAIAAVKLARQTAGRNICLLLIGEGAEYDRLKPTEANQFIHFVGFKSNVRDYFAMADMGFLPTRFKGESFPLVLIDCLHAGKPVLASNISEIGAMLQTSRGLAGELFDLIDWQIPVQQVAQKIVRLAEDRDSYQRLLQLVPEAALKFDPSTMVQKYHAVYQADSIESSHDKRASL